MDEQELLELKQQIDTAKDEVNKLEGRKEHLMQQLEDDWGCKTLDQAKKKLEGLKKKVKKLEGEIETKVDELEERYEFE